MAEQEIQALVEQIIPGAHTQQHREIVAAIVAALTGRYPTLDGQFSDAGCCLIAGVARSREKPLP